MRVKDKQKYLKSSEKLATDFSKDPSTKVGAMVIQDPDVMVSYGYNGMLRGLDDHDPKRQERPEKYFWYEHAERNTIYNKARDVVSGKLMLLNHVPSMESARAISSSGIKTLIFPSFPGIRNESGTPVDEEILTHHRRVARLFRETGVEWATFEDMNMILSHTTHPCFDWPRCLPEHHEDVERLKRKYQKHLDLNAFMAQEFDEPISGQKRALEVACILNPETLTPVASGARGIREIERLVGTDQSAEDSWVEEAAKVAIFNAVRPVFQGSICFSSFMPCIDCARALAQVGVKEVVTRPLDLTQEADRRWQESFEKTERLLHVCDVDVTCLPREEPVLTTASKYKPK